MNPIPLSKKNFQQIIQFYLFETPVRTYIKTRKKEPGTTKDQPNPKYNYDFRKVSKRGITFADRHIDGPKLNSLRAAMKRVTGVKMFALDDAGEILTKAESLKNFEYIIILRNTDNVSVTEGYFYCIRNAFAHGDFDVQKNTYKLKNETNGKVRGLAQLKEKSLLAWIGLVDKEINDIKMAGKK